MIEHQTRNLLSLTEVKAKVGLGKTTIYALMARGEFPKPVPLGASVRWVESEIDTLINGLVEQRDKAA